MLTRNRAWIAYELTTHFFMAHKAIGAKYHFWPEKPLNFTLRK